MIMDLTPKDARQTHELNNSQIAQKCMNNLDSLLKDNFDDPNQPLIENSEKSACSHSVVDHDGPRKEAHIKPKSLPPTPETCAHSGQGLFKYTPMSYSSDSQADSLITEQFYNRRGSQQTCNSSKEDNQMSSQDTENTELDSHISYDDGQQRSSADMDEEFDEQLQKVSKSIQESFQAHSDFHSSEEDEAAYFHLERDNSTRSTNVCHHPIEDKHDRATVGFDNLSSEHRQLPEFTSTDAEGFVNTTSEDSQPLVYGANNSETNTESEYTSKEYKDRSVHSDTETNSAELDRPLSWSPQYHTDDDFALLLQRIVSPVTMSPSVSLFSSAAVTGSHGSVPSSGTGSGTGSATGYRGIQTSVSNDLSHIHNWEFDWEMDALSVARTPASSVSLEERKDRSRSVTSARSATRSSSIGSVSKSSAVLNRAYSDVSSKQLNEETERSEHSDIPSKDNYTDKKSLIEIDVDRTTGLSQSCDEVTFKDKLEHLFQHMDIAFNDLGSRVQKNGVMKAPNDADNSAIMATENDHILSQMHQSPVADQVLETSRLIPDDTNGFHSTTGNMTNQKRKSSSQYSRGSSCEVQPATAMGADCKLSNEIHISNGGINTSARLPNSGRIHLSPTAAMVAHAVPLASMDDFSDQGQTSHETSSARDGDVTEADDEQPDISLDTASQDETEETGESYSLLHSSNMDSVCDTNSTGGGRNGKDRSLNRDRDSKKNALKNAAVKRTDHSGINNVNHNHHRQPHQAVDMNHFSKRSLSQQHQQWIERDIQSTEDLERIFVRNGIDINLENADSSCGIQANHDPLQSTYLNAISSQVSWDFLDFAEKYFNVHNVSTSGPSGALSKTVNFVKRRPNQEVIAVEDLVQYTKNIVLNTSLVRLLNPSKILVAQSLFKDICRYIRGDLKAELAYITLREIVATGIQHIELRDEIYCQILRQSKRNPSEESTCRLWHIMSLCAVSFNPSKTLMKYLVSHLREQADSSDDNVASYAEYCVNRLTTSSREKARAMPPAFPEIEAVVCLQAMVHPIHFLNGRCELLEVAPDCLAKDAVRVIGEQIGLQDVQGWAFYESTPEYDRHIHEDEYLSDIISKWEQKQRKQLADMKLASPKKGSPKKISPKKSISKRNSSPKKSSPTLLSPKLPPLKEFGKLVFCKRMFQPITDICYSDPVELQLLYSQAAHYAVQLDEFNLSVPIAVHLAGLQAQVEFGDFSTEKLYRYEHPSDFICERMLKHSSYDWTNEVASAHKKYGSDKTQTDCMKRYLTIVSQFPLYGCTKIFAHYRGIWQYGAETVLAVDYEGIKFISVQEKTIAFTFYYSEIEDIILEEKRGEFYIVIQLCSFISPSQQKCFLFECLDLEDFGKCIEYHSPKHAAWQQSRRSWRHRQYHPPDDWIKLADNILACRRLLTQKNIITTSSENDKGLIRNALNRLGRSSTSVKESCQAKDDYDRTDSDEYLEFHHPFWSFSKVPFKSSILSFNSHEMEDVAARMFNSTLVYTGLESAAILEDMDLVVVVQTLIIKCMEKDDLCNELYLQLIKQTTNTHSESNQKALIRYWHLMTMATCVMFPPNPVIFNYLTLHLKRYAMQGSQTEAGLYALFCIKCVYRTLEGGGRRWPPSFKEIDFVTNRQAIEARVSLPDGHQMLVEFDSASTCAEVMQLIKAKAGTRLDADGFGMYLVLGETEHYIDCNEKLADSLHQWEKWAKTTGSRDLKFLFKKRLFVDPFMNPHDPVEVDMLYHQAVTDLFDQKIPLTKKDAVDLCALRAQAEFGDFGYANNVDYKSEMRILPRHLRDLIDVSEISTTHKKLVGILPLSANIAFIDVLKHWPLFGATVFEVSNNSEANLPNILWLAVTQLGVHLMEMRGQTIFFTYTFEEICELSPGDKNLTMVVGKTKQSPSLLFITKQAKEIVQLIEDYREATKNIERISNKAPEQSKKSPHKGTGKRSRKRKENNNDVSTSFNKGKKSSPFDNFNNDTISGGFDQKGVKHKVMDHVQGCSYRSSDASLLLNDGGSMVPLNSKESLLLRESVSGSHGSCSSSSSKLQTLCTEV